MSANHPFGTAAVVGLGTVGSALARALARAGVPVIALDLDAQAPDRGGVMPDRVLLTTRPEDLASADLVIEAVPERMNAKCELARRMSKVCSPNSVFVTTTTALAVSEIAVAAGRISRTVGIHLGGSMSDGAAVEMVCTPFTDPAVKDDVRRLLRDLSWTPVDVGDRPGFIGGALVMGYLNAAAAMYEQGYASRDDIDTAMMLGCGLPRGPLAQLDLMGLDVAIDTLDSLFERSGDRRYLPAPILRHMVSAGLLGRKRGRGFYPYRTDGTGAAGEAVAAPRRPSTTTARPVRRVGIVGTGTMAVGIAQVCAQAGYPTVMAGRTETKVKDAIGRIERSLSRLVQKGITTSAEAADSMARLSGSCDFTSLADCDLAIEAVVEDLTVKRRIFAELDKVCRAGAVLSTTTSSLPVIECAVSTNRPEDVIGLHFFNPANRMKLVEVVRTVLTSDDAIATAHHACACLGKHGVDCGDRSGFIVNALLFPYLNQAAAMLHDGYATDDDIETVMRHGWGYPMGPIRLLDTVGLDVSVAILHRLYETFRDPVLIPANSLDQLVLAGRLGVKSGQGFRVYEVT